MKLFYTRFFIFGLLLFSAAAHSQNKIYTDNGSTQSYNLKANDVLTIASGEFKGSIQGFFKSATINVAKGATFNPASFQNASGMLTVYGTARFENLTVDRDFVLTNEGTVAVTNFNLNGAIKLINKAQGTIYISQLSPFQNAGSEINNAGMFYLGSDLTISANVPVTNQTGAKFYIGGNANYNSVALVNDGYVRVKGVSNLNGGTFTNNCSYVADNGLNNNGGTTKNYGTLLIAPSGSANNFFQNSIGFYNAPGAMVQGGQFSSNAQVTGGGNFRFTGSTQTSAAFGNDGGGINFFDAGLPATIMDVENTKPHSSVTKRAVPAVDTNTLKVKCTIDLSLITLPIKLLSFSGQVVNDDVVLTWEAGDNETGDYFEVQQRTTGAGFQPVGLIFTSEKQSTDTYRFKTPLAGQASAYRLKIVNKDNSISYSKVLSFKRATANNSKLTLLQNPVAEGVSFAVTAIADETALVCIYDVTGIKIWVQKIQVRKGNNAISIPFNKALPSGMYILEVITTSGRSATTFIKSNN